MWKVIGASVTGTSHEAVGTGCEDASSWQVGPEVTCLAVADGAGSRPLSGRGAALAVEHALLIAHACAGRTEPDAPQTWLRLIVKDIREQIAMLADAEGRKPGDFATTLGVAILTSTVACVGQIGDTIAVLGQAGQYRTVAPAPRAEYVNETSFVTDNSAMEQLRVTIEPIADVDSVFLSTDGLRFKVLDNLRSGSCSAVVPRHGYPTPTEFYEIHLPIVHSGSAPGFQYRGLPRKKMPAERTDPLPGPVSEP